MNCQEFERQWAELEDSSQLPSELEEHRRFCRACGELLEDLNQITQTARQMRTSEEPPERVWLHLRRQLEQEGVIREPGRGWFRAPASAWFPLFRGLAYASVFVVAVGAMYLHSLLSNPSVPPMLAVTPTVPESAFTPSLPPAPEKNVDELAAKVPVEHRATFVANWNQMTSSIEQLSHFVEAHPEDPFAQTQLTDLFQQRDQLWQTLVKWEEF